jgi:hypothetical protein
MTTIRDIIDRDLSAEISGGGVVKVIDKSLLEADLREYVLTDQLAKEFARVVEPVVEAARPAATGSDKVGIWVSGFFGSGKSHFAKLLGHVLADTAVASGGARELFERHLVAGRPADDRLRDLLQQARVHELRVHLVPFDIMAFHAGADDHIGIVVLRALHTAEGLSKSIVVAEHEAEIKAHDKWEEFLQRYRDESGTDWFEERDMAIVFPTFATVLAEVLPERFASADLALRSLELANDDLRSLTPAGAVAKLNVWLTRRAAETPGRHVLLFVVDEVGAWSGRQLKRIEQVRSFVEQLAVDGKGKIWFLATSQEKLSDVVQNTEEANVNAANELLQRLTARFQTNVHLESSEVGTVIENRVLAKKPAARKELTDLWASRLGVIKDLAETGIKLNGAYPSADEERFVRDYPFLPYQLPLAADIFGAMRGVKVSGGARSMIKVAFDATSRTADQDVGAVISWDQIFDSANQDNEFKDEKYLGSHGLTHIEHADRDLAASTPVKPSRVLKVLWLAQQTGRVPGTVKNLARMLADRLDADILRLEADVRTTLERLAELSYVRQDVGTEAWRFLTPDEVTVEKLVNEISEQVPEKDVRSELHKISVDQIKAQFPGRLTHGKSRTTFRYGLSLNSDSIANEAEAVSLALHFDGSEGAKRSDREFATYLDRPEVVWVIDIPDRLTSRLRRAIAIDRLSTDERFRSIATERTQEEAKRLEAEAARSRREIATDVDRALDGGTLYWGGTKTALATAAGKSTSAKARIEAALHEAVDAAFDQFTLGDRAFEERNIDRVLTVPPSQRAALDAGVGFFDGDGHVHPDHPVLERVMQHLQGSTKTTGADVVGRFEAKPYGWPADLARYAAASLFVDGKIALLDPAGTRWDDPSAPQARAQLGTAAFRKVSLVVEEAPLLADELANVRKLLSDLGQPTPDGTESTLHDGVRKLQAKLAERLASVARAEQVGLPLPASIDGLRTALDDIAGAGTRAKTLRAAIHQLPALRAGVASLDAIDTFAANHGFEQFDRAMKMLDLAERSGLADDAIHGETIRDAREQLEAIRDQRRVIDEWNGPFQTYRQNVLDAYRATYVPLRDGVRQSVEEARSAILDDPDFQGLPAADAVRIRASVLAPGNTLAEMSAPDLKSEKDLLDAATHFSIAHLRTINAAIPGELARARGLIIDLKNKDDVRQTVTWRSADHLVGRTFTEGDQVRHAFDTARDEILTDVEAGKIVKVI